VPEKIRKNRAKNRACPLNVPLSGEHQKHRNGQAEQDERNERANALGFGFAFVESIHDSLL
jgi:hypothetical protein